MESFEVLGVFGNVSLLCLVMNLTNQVPRLVFWRLFHGGLPCEPRIHWHISVGSNSLLFLVSLMVRRYLNNPEVMSGAAFFGLALVSGSKLVISLAVIRHLSHWWFLSMVEKYDAFLNFWTPY